MVFRQRLFQGPKVRQWLVIVVAVTAVSHLSHKAQAGPCTDAYIACIEECRSNHGYTGTWRDLGNIALQLCYQECNLDLLNCLAGKAPNLNDFMPKININLGSASAGFVPGTTVNLSAGLLANPTPGDGWSAGDYYSSNANFASIDGNDWSDIRFEYSTDPTNDGWQPVQGSAISVNGDLYEQSWNAPDDVSSVFVRFAFDSETLADGLDDPISAHMQFTATPEPSSFALLGIGVAGLIPVLRRRRQQRPSANTTAV